jgi:DNA-directed RNA polymerase subunit RPC12/RpoP
MFIKFHCCHCGHKLKALLALAGERAKCSRCSQTILVPPPEAIPVTIGGRIPQPLVTRFPIAAIPFVFIVGAAPLKSPGKNKVFCFGVGGIATAGL